VFAFALELQQHVEFFRLGIQRFAGSNALLDARTLAADFLCRLRVLPENGRGDLPLDLLQRIACAVEVKDNSGPTRAGL